MDRILNNKINTYLINIIRSYRLPSQFHIKFIRDIFNIY